MGLRVVKYVGRIACFAEILADQFLSVMGETGVRHVMKGLLADLDIMFNVAGCQNVGQIDRTWIESHARGYTLLKERSMI